MQVTDDIVKNIAELAQLKVTESDIPALATAMQNILDLAEQMQSIDTSNIEPVSNPLDATQVLRPDEITETDMRDSYQAVAPEVESGLYLVPRVVE